MTLQSENIIAGRTLSLMLFVVILAAAGIALANTSTKLLTLDEEVEMMHRQKPIERAYD